MISQADMQVTQVDLTLFSTVLIVSNIVSSQLEHTRLFSEKWMHLAIATLIGVVLHGLLTNQVSGMATKALSTNNVGVKKSVYDLIKFGTIFLSQKVITSYLENKDVNFDQRWMMTSALTIVGYAGFNMLESYVPAVPAYQPLFNDIIKVSMGALLASYLVDGTITQGHIMGLVATLSGFVAFHLVTKNLVVPNEKFETFGGYSTMPESDDN
jgi:hypothetical protein